MPHCTPSGYATDREERHHRVREEVVGDVLVVVVVRSVAVVVVALTGPLHVGITPEISGKFDFGRSKKRNKIQFGDPK